MRYSLITGATSVVGSSLLIELLETTTDTLLVLIRPSQQKSSRDRLREVLGKLEYTKIPWDRIHLYSGELLSPQLGLTATDYGKLVEQVNHIFHCAASVELFDSLEVTHRNVVVPTQSMLELQKQILLTRFCQMEYVSSVGVLGCLNKPLTETPLLETRKFHNFYEQSKAEAEQLIYEAAQHQLPIVIHRPSMVVGHSKTGVIAHYKIFYFILRFLKGDFFSGLLPTVGQLQLDTIPCDSVSQILVASSHRPVTEMRILHHCSGPEWSIKLADLQKWITPSSKWSLSLPMPLLRRGLRLGKHFFFKNSSQKKLNAMLAILDYTSGSQQFSNAQTRALLKEWSITIPEPSQYLPTVLERYFQDQKTKG